MLRIDEKVNNLIYTTKIPTYGIISKGYDNSIKITKNTYDTNCFYGYIYLYL